MYFQYIFPIFQVESFGDPGSGRLGRFAPAHPTTSPGPKMSKRHIFCQAAQLQQLSEKDKQWIGLREKLQETPKHSIGQSLVSGSDFPLSQSIEINNMLMCIYIYVYTNTHTIF